MAELGLYIAAVYIAAFIVRLVGGPRTIGPILPAIGWLKFDKPDKPMILRGWGIWWYKWLIVHKLYVTFKEGFNDDESECQCPSCTAARQRDDTTD